MKCNAKFGRFAKSSVKKKDRGISHGLYIQIKNRGFEAAHGLECLYVFGYRSLSVSKPLYVSLPPPKVFSCGSVLFNFFIHYNISNYYL